MPTPPPHRLVPYLDSASDADIGTLVKAAVKLVRREAGLEEDDETAGVEIKVTLRRS